MVALRIGSWQDWCPCLARREVIRVRKRTSGGLFSSLSRNTRSNTMKLSSNQTWHLCFPDVSFATLFEILGIVLMKIKILNHNFLPAIPKNLYCNTIKIRGANILNMDNFPYKYHFVSNTIPLRQSIFLF